MMHIPDASTDDTNNTNNTNTTTNANANADGDASANANANTSTNAQLPTRAALCQGKYPVRCKLHNS